MFASRITIHLPFSIVKSPFIHHFWLKKPPNLCCWPLYSPFFYAAGQHIAHTRTAVAGEVQGFVTAGDLLRNFRTATAGCFSLVMGKTAGCIIYDGQNLAIWLVVQFHHLEKSWSSSMGRMTSLFEMENKIHVWNHQPEYGLTIEKWGRLKVTLMAISHCEMSPFCLSYNYKYVYM